VLQNSLLIYLLLAANAVPPLVSPTPTPSPAPAAEFPVDLDWSRAPVWDDGLAEVAHYDSRRTVYGTERSFESILITVKEDFDGALGVKADPPLEGRSIVTVLKMNLISRIQTDDYPYDYMFSVFVRRDDPRVLVKLAGSSQEWCGTTFKEVVTWEGPARLRFHSYFDGQADGEHPLDLAGGALLEEQLSLVLRAAALAPAAPHRFALFDSLITNTARQPRSREMVASLAGEERLVTPAGEFSTRRIEVRPAVEGAGPAFTYWIDQGPGRALVKMVASDGRSHSLKSVSRRNYWARARPAP